jgi:hypothetical protein
MTVHWSRFASWAVVAFVAMWIVGAPSSLLSQGPGMPGNAPTINGQLQMVTSTLPNGIQQIVILDSPNRSLAVYTVEGGNLQLRCVRSLVYDLRMEEFNGAPPLPSELRRVQP